MKHALVAGGALLLAGCLDATLPNVNAGALRPPDADTAVLLSVGDVETAQTTYTLRQPLTLPTLVFDGPGGGVLRLRFRNLASPGTETTDGQSVVFEWTAPDGRRFTPETACALTVTDPRDPASAPWIEGQTICEVVATDGTRATIATSFVVTEP